MQTLKEQNLKKFCIILTDKDFAKINAVQTVQPEIQISNSY